MELIENKRLGFKLTYLKVKDKVWIKGNELASQLLYSKPNKAILTHVPDKHKSILEVISKGVVNRYDLKNEQPNTTMVSFPTGALYLLGASKMEKGEQFRAWMYEEVVPQIIATGQYSLQPITIRTDRRLTVNNEFDLQKEVIEYLRLYQEKYHLKIIVPLGENQDTEEKRINSRILGYESGQPDIIITNPSIHHSGLIIELKSPTGYGELSNKQRAIIERYKEDNYRIIVSNDLKKICGRLAVWFTHLRLQCKYCSQKFKSQHTREKHYKYFHKIEK